MRRCNVLLTLFGLSALLVPAAAFAAAPTHTLRLGDSVPDVLLLQQLLNMASDTQVAATGPGAPGQESTYFGAKTADAVRRFQWKYKDDILTPSQLVTPTGFVGLATLKKLQSFAVQPSPTVSRTPSVTQAPAPISQTTTPDAAFDVIKNHTFSTSTLGFTPLTPTLQVPPGVNPNSINLEYAIQEVRAYGKQQGLTDQQLTQQETLLRQLAATTTDLGKTFFKQAGYPSVTHSMSKPWAAALRDALASRVMRVLVAVGLMPQTAYANALDTVTGSVVHITPVTVPFGGLIVMAYPCTCTAGTVWQVVLAPPLPPSYATVLNAVPGLERFAWYNIPLVGIETLGFYAPATAAACWEGAPPYCVPFPAAGTITPFSGSSATPL